MPAFFYQTTRGQLFRLLKEGVIWRDINKTESKLSNIVYIACAFGPYTTNKTAHFHCWPVVVIQAQSLMMLMVSQYISASLTLLTDFSTDFSTS